jgi:hypothetical protein
MFSVQKYDLNCSAKAHYTPPILLDSFPGKNNYSEKGRNFRNEATQNSGNQKVEIV